MKQIFRSYYTPYEYDGDLFKNCTFIDGNGNESLDIQINNYIVTVMEWDIYLFRDIQKHFSLIEQAESNPNKIYYGGGQTFALQISAEKVVFYHNEFDEEDGFPILSCPLSTFKTALIAWNAFLQLPKNIYSVVETLIEE